MVGHRSLAARVSDYAGWASKDVVEQVKIAAFVPRQLLQFDWGWWRGLAQNKAFRTTLRFPSGETSEKIPFACACSVRGIVSAHRCLSAVGFSSPTCKLGASRHLRKALFFGLRFMVAVRRAPSWRAGFRVYRSTNLRTAASIRLVAKGTAPLIPRSCPYEEDCSRSTYPPLARYCSVQ